VRCFKILTRYYRGAGEGAGGGAGVGAARTGWMGSLGVRTHANPSVLCLPSEAAAAFALLGLVVRGVTQEIDFFWIALVVTQVNYVHRPRYKLQIYEEIAEKYYRSQKLCRRKVRNFFT